MSWKGFKKAVERLPHQVMNKVGHSSATVDAEYEDLQGAFRALETHTQRLASDARAFKEALLALLQNQANIADTLSQIYHPIVPKVATSDASQNDPSARNLSQGFSQMSIATNEKEQVIKEYRSVLKSVHEEAEKNAEIIERRIIRPTEDILEAFKGIHKSITKRAHKLTDYDRHRTSVEKLRATPQRDAKDEKRLFQLEHVLQQATLEYERYNHLLKTELPRVLALRTEWVEPCVQVLYIFQGKFYATLKGRLEAFVFGADLRDEALVREYETRTNQVKESLMQLSMLKLKPFDPNNPDPLWAPTPLTGTCPQNYSPLAPSVPNYGSASSAAPEYSAPTTAAALTLAPSPGPSTSTIPPPYSAAVRPTRNSWEGSARPNQNTGMALETSPHTSVEPSGPPGAFPERGTPQPGPSTPGLSPGSFATPGTASTPRPKSPGLSAAPKSKPPLVPSPLSKPSTGSVTGSPSPSMGGSSFAAAKATAEAAMAKSRNAPPSTPEREHVVALFDFSPQAEGDLGFEQGDRIEVVEKTESTNDWWKGRLRGKVGVFPANYVEFER